MSYTRVPHECLKAIAEGLLVLANESVDGVVAIGKFDRRRLKRASRTQGAPASIFQRVKQRIYLFSRIGSMGHGAVKPLPKIIGRYPQMFDDQIVFGGKVTIESHLCHIRFEGNVVDSYSGKSALVEKPGGALYDTFFCGRSV